MMESGLRSMLLKTRRRQRPSFIADTGVLTLPRAHSPHRLFEIVLDVAGRCLDVRAPHQAALVGIPFERLSASDADEVIRYAECSQLADLVEPVGPASPIRRQRCRIRPGAWLCLVCPILQRGGVSALWRSPCR